MTGQSFVIAFIWALKVGSITGLCTGVALGFCIFGVSCIWDTFKMITS